MSSPSVPLDAAGALPAGGVMLGTAGWSIPRAVAARFPGEGPQLARYARTMPAVEINSSFYRSHRVATYERWAAAVPEAFRFAVKLPKTISHVRRLVGVDELVDAFAGETAGLGAKRAVVLVQLPPSLAFEAETAAAFFALLGRRMAVATACEPRHGSWFTAEAEACLAHHHVARVVADPVLAAGGERPGGWPGLRYRRLHGSPHVYHSPYDEPNLRRLAQTLRAETCAGGESWCVFDNTASGAAAENALALRALLDG